MGRDLFRRKAVALLLLLGSLCPAARAEVQEPQPLAVLHGREQNGLSGFPLADHPAVAAWKQRILGSQMPAVAAALERAVLYRRFVSARLAEMTLPQELLYLPILESHYRVRALSRSGAGGMWQIMGNTAGALRLSMNRWLDERRDFWKSTEAALRKLQENYRTFGNWDLALAAYNCGAGKLSRTINAAGGLRDFWLLKEQGLLPAETADYVPKFHALVEICSRPLSHGLPVSWQEAPTWERIALERSVELALLAGAADLPLELLQAANAELEAPITPPSGSAYLLKVPVQRADEVRKALADPQVQLLRYSYHRIRSGDTLYALSVYYGVGVPLLLEANPGIDPRALRIGAELRVPLLAGAPIRSEPADPAACGPPQEFRGSHRVQSGDTLWAISRRYGTTVEELARVNARGLDDLLKAGETLKVPELEGEIR